jgi:hypothetical protein
MLVIILFVCVFLTGCWTSNYRHYVYNVDGSLKEIITLENAKAMVETKVGVIDINLPDGAILHLEKGYVYYDPNSWEHIGRGISASGIPMLLVP